MSPKLGRCLHDQQAVTTSLRVAKRFKKQHKNVIRDIKNLAAQNGATSSLFVEGDCLDSKNHKQPLYYMNRDGFTIS